MTTNRLAKPQEAPKLTLQERLEESNAKLFKAGRNDIRWVIRDGHLHLEWCEPPASQFADRSAGARP